MSGKKKALTHIACVDDDEDILQVAALTLRTIGGYKVTTFPGGHEALAGLATAAPDLILLDVMMPTMDGPTTLIAIKNRDDLKHLPVVFMTARIQTSERKEYELLGAAGVLAKPFDPATLSSDLQRIWDART